MTGVPEPRPSLAQAQERRWEGAPRARTHCPSAEKTDLLLISAVAEGGEVEQPGGAGEACFEYLWRQGRLLRGEVLQGTSPRCWAQEQSWEARRQERVAGAC